MRGVGGKRGVGWRWRGETGSNRFIRDGMRSCDCLSNATEVNVCHCEKPPFLVNICLCLTTNNLYIPILVFTKSLKFELFSSEYYISI
jgi:hypothetical protein